MIYPVSGSSLCHAEILRDERAHEVSYCVVHTKQFHLNKASNLLLIRAKQHHLQRGSGNEAVLIAFSEEERKPIGLRLSKDYLE